MMRLFLSRQARYQARHLRTVRCISLNPQGQGITRIRLVPPKSGAGYRVPYLVLVNGKDLLSLNLSWAVLLNLFIDSMTPYDGQEVNQATWDSVMDETAQKARKVYPREQAEVFRRDLNRLLNAFFDISAGRETSGQIGLIALKAYADRLLAPNRMDLMVSAINQNGRWYCNNHCMYCYGAGKPLADRPELPTQEWKTIIDKCIDAGIPQLTFAGGEPTLRPDLVPLIRHAAQAVTRLNTNGMLLSPNLCQAMYEASLDGIQITLYSSNKDVHNKLVGVDGYKKTMAGIRNALAAGLNVTVHTPLCRLNQDYPETVQALCNMGVTDISCSVLYPANEEHDDDCLNLADMKVILAKAAKVSHENNTRISFTSPGWFTESELRKIGYTTMPFCGACLGSMAIAPDGQVIPCKNWLHEEGLGNILQLPWQAIWNHPKCKKIRQESAGPEDVCLLQKQTEQ